MRIRTYTELQTIKTFIDRYNYLRLEGTVGQLTFGHDRYLNQLLYLSDSWKEIRRKVIIRDEGCDLGIDGYEIHDRIYVHHMNPITVKDIECKNPEIFNIEFLICTTFNTHNAIHFGDESLLPLLPVERKPNDTCPWL